MNRVSTKRRALLAESQPWREELVAQTERCEWCGRLREDLAPHEIARGCDRSKALMARFAILVVCWDCHRETDRLPRAGQLALLYLVRSADYDLAAYHAIIGGRRSPEQWEVDLWIRRLTAGKR